MKISIIRGEITKVKADAIVNPANSTLLGGSGADGEIHRIAGRELKEECQRIRDSLYPKGLPTGEAVVTKAYALPAKIIIHTVGPRFYSQDVSLLKNSYVNSLRLAEEQGCESIAFPAIATGAYGVPIKKSAEIVKSVLENYKSEVIKEVILVLYREEDFKVYKEIFVS